MSEIVIATADGFYVCGDLAGLVRVDGTGVQAIQNILDKLQLGLQSDEVIFQALETRTPVSVTGRKLENRTPSVQK